MKILFIGDIRPGQTSRMRMRALERLGHDVAGFDTATPWLRTSWMSRQLSRRLERGPVVEEINKGVREAATMARPALVWAEKQEYLSTATLESIKRGGARLVHFTPDPYFYLDWKRTASMDAALPIFDVLAYCKTYEQGSYESVGPPTIFLPLGYCDETHRPNPPVESRWNCDIGFVGGWEPRRQAMLSSVANVGPSLNIWGAYWDAAVDGKWSLRRHMVLRQLAGSDRSRIATDDVLLACLRGKELYGAEYAQALSGAKVGVGFLRKVCPDQHTTRSFEIPACGSMLLADRTQEHLELFSEGVEADYFSSPEEFASKATFYASYPEAAAKIAAAGLRRSHKSGYAYVDRLACALKQIRDI